MGKNILIDDIKYWHNALFVFDKQCFKSYIDYLSRKQSIKHPFIQRIHECVQASVKNKDKQVNMDSNPLILSNTDNQKNNGHAKIIKENLKTFKDFKDIYGLIQSVENMQH